MAADAATASRVLADHNHLSDFVPDLVTSRIVSDKDPPLRLEQRGEARLLWLRTTVQRVLELDAPPPPGERIAFRAVSGNVRHMQGAWNLLRETDRLVFRYDADIEPDFRVPPLRRSSAARYACLRRRR